MQAMEAERTKVNVARERAVVVHQETQTEHKRAVMMVLPFPVMLIALHATYVSSVIHAHRSACSG